MSVVLPSKDQKAVDTRFQELCLFVKLVPCAQTLIIRDRLSECVRAIEEQQLTVDRAKEEKAAAIESRRQLEFQARGLEV
jgi:hypothetical protein